MVKRLLVKKRKKLLDELTREIPSSGIITVGNDASATIELKDERIAPEQLVIVCENQSLTLLCRVDGTVVNGRGLPQGALHDLLVGDEIVIDGYTILAVNGDKPAGVVDVAAETEEEIAVVAEIAEPDVPATEDRTEKSLNDVLDALRTEEKFYFLIRSGAAETRVAVESDDMYAGWNEAGECVVSATESDVPTVRAQVRKDWSGVVVHPRKPGAVKINDEMPEGARRLKNDDVLRLVGRDGLRLDQNTTLKFHEPTALLILDSILPKELPPPISLDDTNADAGAGELDEGDAIHASKVPSTPKKKLRKRNIFGYFTITELIIMAIGTLITAAVIFLVLELY